VWMMILSLSMHCSHNKKTHHLPVSFHQTLFYAAFDSDATVIVYHKLQTKFPTFTPPQYHQPGYKIIIVSKELSNQKVYD